MPFITTPDGAEIFYKDWGPRNAQPIVFHHGWPLSSDDWDTQMMFFLGEGYRVVAHDRRGHGRSSQTDSGNEMDTYAADVQALVTQLDLRDAIHVGHSTGGGEVAHYVARAEPGRVAKAVLLDAVPPVMVKKDSNPGGTPIEVFDGFRSALAANRAQLYLDIPSGPFYNFNRHGVTPIEGLIRNWWRQGMMGSVKAGYECIKAFSETDFTEDLKAIEHAGAGDPQRRRPDRALRQFGAARGATAPERQPENLQGPAPRLPFDAPGADQRRHPRLRQRPTGRPEARRSAGPGRRADPRRMTKCGLFSVALAFAAAAALPVTGAAAVAPFPAGFHTQDVAANGTTIHVRIGGHGPAVLLIHGFGDTGDMWAPLAARLARDHTIIVPDLRGMGLSAHPETRLRQEE